MSRDGNNARTIAVLGILFPLTIFSVELTPSSAGDRLS